MSVDVVGYTRLMGRDEVGTLGRLRALRTDVVEPVVARHGGRFIKLMGDGALLEFKSAIRAVECGLEIQRGVEGFNAHAGESPEILMRLAVHLGDIIIAGRDIYGDGVNIAARLEGIAPPGGICVSDDVRRIVEGKIAARLDDFGMHELKNVEKPVQAFVVRAGADDAAGPDDARSDEKPLEVRYCRARDGVNIAYVAVGEGPPLLKAANFLTHLEFERQSPVWRHWFTELSKGYRYIRYDARGNGLSDWDVADISFETFVSDLEVVADALGLERFPILGISQGCAVAIEYAVRHPERVSCLVLCGGYAAGWRKVGNRQWSERRDAMLELIPAGWGLDNPAFRQAYTSLFVPNGTAGQHRWFNNLQKVSATPENAYRILRAFAGIDVRHLLGRISQPTLVLHCRDDAIVPVGVGRQLTAAIPDARFVELDGANHIILREDACWPRFLSEVRAFLARHAH